MAKRKTKPKLATTWRKPPAWSHIPGEPTRAPIVPAWALDLVAGRIAAAPAVPLMGYQEHYLSLPDRFTAWLASRQIGKSWTISLKHVLRVQKAEEEKRGHRVIVFSAGKEAAQENIRYATLHARAFSAFRAAELAITETNEVYQDDPAQERYAKFSVEFPGSGFSSIAAIAANPYTAVGRSANIVGDEVSRWRDARQVWDAIVPFVTRGNLTIDLCSTPLGPGNLWHDLCTHAERYGLTLVTTTIWDAIQDIELVLHLLPEAQAEQLRIDPAALYRKCGDDNIWAQNYLCQFVDTQQTLLGLDTITACEAEGILWHSLSEGLSGAASRSLFGGWDVARKHDLSVLWIDELVGDVLVTRWLEEMRNVPLPTQYDLAERILQCQAMRRLDVDETGMGLALREFLTRRFGSGRVGGVTFTGPARVELAKRFKARFEDRLIRVPANNPLLRADLRLVKKEDTLSSERIVIEDSGESHADRFWAGALATYAHYETTAAIGSSPASSPATTGWSGALKRNPAASLAQKLLTRAA